MRPAHALWLLPLAGYLLLASVPPWDRDEMVYHLALPRELARAGRWVRPDDNIFASLPLGWESAVSLLYALGSRGEPLFNPRLLGAWTALAAALATTGLARSLGARAPWLAGAALLAVPTFVEFGSSAYVEPYLVLLVVLALVGVARTVAGSPAWVLPAALFAGAAASVKYPGLVVVVLLAFALLVDRPQQVTLQAPALRRAALFLTAALVVACPFYVRNAIQRRNPFFPMAFELFGGQGWDDTRATAYWETLRAYGAADDLPTALALPLRIFVTRDLDHGFQGSIGPAALLGFAAMVVLLRRRGAGAPERYATIAVAIFASAFFVFWMATVRQARFLLPAVAPLLALLATCVSSCGDQGAARGPRRDGAGALVLATSLAWGAGLYATLWTRQRTWAWISGAVTRDELLARLMPESYVPLRELSALVPPDGRVWLVWTRGYTYYLDRPYRLDSVFEGWRFEALIEDARDVASFTLALGRDGITHVLLNERFFLHGGSADTAPGRTDKLAARFAVILARGGLVEERRWGRVVLYRVAPTPDPGASLRSPRIDAGAPARE